MENGEWRMENGEKASRRDAILVEKKRFPTIRHAVGMQHCPNHYLNRDFRKIFKIFLI
jgi:hypothetical protein